MYKLNVNRTVSNRKIENIIKNLVPRWKSDGKLVKSIRFSQYISIN